MMTTKTASLKNELEKAISAEIQAFFALTMFHPRGYTHAEYQEAHRVAVERTVAARAALAEVA